MTQVILSVTSQNAPDHSRLTPGLVYGTVRDAKDGHLMISATLEYIAKEIRKRGYRIVSVDGNGFAQETGQAL